MTVAVGFRCTDGIVLAADSELTFGSAKLSGPKAWSYSYSPARADFRVGIVGAGDHGYIQFAADQIDQRLRALTQQLDQADVAPTVDDLQSVVQVVVNEIHHDHLYPYSQSHPYDPLTVELLVGMRLEPNALRLVRTSLTSVTKVWNFAAIGIGSHLANFLATNSNTASEDPTKGRVPMAHGVFWATQILMHVKKHVTGCGGQSDVIAMFERGVAGLIKQQTIHDHEEFLAEFEGAIRPVLFGGSDPTLADEGFEKLVDVLAIKLKEVRKAKVIRQRAEQMRRDVTIQVPSIASAGAVGSPTVRIDEPKPTVGPKGGQ